MLAVKMQYGAWHELFRGVVMSANLGKEGLSASTRSLAKKHAEYAAETIARNFEPHAQSDARSGLASWIAAHLEVASEQTDQNVSELRAVTDRLARILVLNAPGDSERQFGPPMSSEDRIVILEGRLQGAVDRFIELLACKLEKKGIRKAQIETKKAAEAVARFAAEWIV